MRRQPQPGDRGVLTREIRKLAAQTSELAAERDRLAERISTELGKDAPDFQEQSVAHCRVRLAEVDRRHQISADRIAALEARLPTEQRRIAAGQECVAGLAAVASRETEFRTAVVEATGFLTRAAGRLLDAATSQDHAWVEINKLADVIGVYGLTDTVPDYLALTRQDRKAFEVVALLLAETEAGQVSIATRDALSRTLSMPTESIGL